MLVLESGSAPESIRVPVPVPVLASSPSAVLEPASLPVPGLASDSVVAPVLESVLVPESNSARESVIPLASGALVVLGWRSSSTQLAENRIAVSVVAAQGAVVRQGEV